jgi:hypothetical protein
MSEWLDLELSHHLAPTIAPDELWSRVCVSQPVRARRVSQIFALPVAAAATLVLAGALYFIARGQPSPAPFRATNPAAECLSCHT